ncbi:hypothetical protein EYF80_068152 [Liparis tanakae]|uniref:Uncharacterized protein n=1 Tax=Liparis tanakae TaxID=230148 RepID=A0A4Z2DYY5_9TELE|nr:hypothetical protein EYF80_068152 [Liparis tanakae]
MLARDSASPWGSRPSLWRSRPMATIIWSKVSSCCVARSTRAGQVGLHWGHWQESTRWNGQPLAGGVLLWRAASRLRSQQCSARGREVPFTWKLIQLLEEMKRQGSYRG